MNKIFGKLLLLTTVVFCIFLLLESKSSTINANSNLEDEPSSFIDVTTTEEGGDTVTGNPTITAVPNPDKAVDSVQFFAKAINEPESAYYPYAPDTTAPYSWNWPTGDPWVPDGEYILKMDITYSSGEVETITRNIFVDNYTEPNTPDSPKDLTVTSRTGNSVALSWATSTSTKLHNYEIYQNGDKIAETTNTSYEATNLTTDTLYQYRVVAKDIYNNISIDDNRITILTNESIDTMPTISEIEAPKSNGVTPGEDGFAGTIKLSVNAGNNDSVENVEFYVKPYGAPEEDYWQFPNVTVDGDSYSINWDTTSAQEGNAIIKAVAHDDNDQLTTVTKVLLVDNDTEGYEPPAWDPADTPPANRIVGYLAGWSTYGSFDIKRDLDASRLTHLNYAFGLISDDLQLVMSDPVQDPVNFEALADVKEEYPHLKTLIAVGGWGGSANFSEAAATEESRIIFAKSAVDFIVEHGFDGIDLDWEYPVTGGGPGTYPNPEDRENFPLLLEKVREKLDEQGEKDGKHYLLTIAGAANTGFIDNTQIGSSHEYLDYVQVMTYDLHGTWESVADFNAPLYDDNEKTWSVDRAIQAYLDAGVPANKLVMGTPFYGYTYNVTSDENNGLRQPFESSGSVTYNRIVQDDYLNNGYVRYWDEGTQVPYLFNEEESIFITYDDEESMTLKAEYIREHGLGGAMIWEISQDHGIDLLNSLYTVLKDPIESSLEDATISVEDNTLLQGAEMSAELVVTLSNGEMIDLTETEVEWITTNSAVATVEDGLITAKNAGITDIYAIVSYNDEDITSNTISINVDVTATSLTDQITILKEDGHIEHSTFKQLTNRLKQAEHHYQGGRTRQAVKHLDDFRKHLNKSNAAKSVKTLLTNNVNALEAIYTN